MNARVRRGTVVLSASTAKGMDICLGNVPMATAFQEVEEGVVVAAEAGVEVDAEVTIEGVVVENGRRCA